MFKAPKEEKQETGFRMILIGNKPEIQHYQGSSYFIELDCRVTPNFNVKKSIWYRTKAETVNGYEMKPDLWKVSRLMKQAKVEPITVTEEGGQEYETYDESMLQGKALIALMYRKPDTGYMEIFDFLPEDATDDQKSALFTRFEKWFGKKYGETKPEKEPPREVVSKETEDDENPVDEEPGF